MAAAPVPDSVPVKRKTSPLVWVLIIVLGLFVLGGIVTGGAVMFFLHKARQAGFDAGLIGRNPGLAISKMIAAANPDVEVLSTDDGSGKITMRDKKTGKVVWKEKIIGNYSASPIASGKRIYLFCENGKTHVLQAGKEFKLLTTNDLGEKIMATPAVSGNTLFLRHIEEFIAVFFLYFPGKLYHIIAVITIGRYIRFLSRGLQVPCI